ncbi:hypothetical protein GWO43_13795, partial [candidate division KSB1 bacterium]|nr:hypothetical protein [candidate division KSB1 bacterium]NIX71600.1 hypothetical protein [candidate division KSB1 bacterium]
MNRTVKITLIALLVIGVGSYTYLKAQPLVHGPEIQVFSPRNGTMLEDPLVGVTGTAKHISYLHINGRQIFTDEAGQFSEQL